MLTGKGTLLLLSLLAIRGVLGRGKGGAGTGGGGNSWRGGNLVTGFFVVTQIHHGLFISHVLMYALEDVGLSSLASID